MRKLVAAAAVVYGAIASCAAGDILKYTNSTPIDWGMAGTSTVTQGEAVLFPSQIDVPDHWLIAQRVCVTLHDVTHTYSGDLEISLRSPDGTVVMLVADAGGSGDWSGDITFDVRAAQTIDESGDSIISGAYRPSINPDESIDTTGPSSNSANLEDFASEFSLGVWELFVYDDTQQDTGSIAGGWTLMLDCIPSPGSCSGLGFAGWLCLRRRRTAC